MNKIMITGLVAVSAGLLFLNSCKKSSSDETTTVSVPPPVISNPISDAAPLHGGIKGTMLAGKTYTIDGDVVINKGDTVLIQEGVTVNLTASASIAVYGIFISVGTKDKPNKISVSGITKTDMPGIDPSVDPAFSGKWCGINCDTSCTLLVLKWTHIEFGGATFGTNNGYLVYGNKAGSKSYTILFQNANGSFVMEDSWLYGSIDDAVRIQSGKIHIMRNTFEKAGYIGGDCLNAKSGTVGDMAYNLFVGTATNGTKASNKGGNPIQTNINMFNNTYINGGYRQVQTGRGGCLNYEEGAKGTAYNNLMVNCKFSFRIVGSPAADTINMQYGNNYRYGDSDNVTSQFYPTGYITIPKSTDIPNPSFLPTGYLLGDVYTPPASLRGANNPKFVTFSLPSTTAHLNDINYATGFNFHLQSSSPAIGKGFTGFTAIAPIPVNAIYGATEITQPGIDIGCYQSNGKGNQH